MRVFVALAMITGAIVGIFWLYAIDAEVNGAIWPPHWRSWTAHVTCPFIPMVGMNGVANALVPALNALVYGLLAWGILRIKKSTAP